MALTPPPAPWAGMPSVWKQWFDRLQQTVNTGGGTVAFNNLDFTGSNITSILTRTHNSLQSIQGGSAGDYNHLTTAQVNAVNGAVQDPGSNGLIARTGAGTYAARTLTAPAAGITVSNGSGAGGNPTLALADDLNALESLATTGFAKRTGASTWSTDATVVTGPGSSTDNAIARFDGTSGILLQNSGVTISDNGQINCAAGTTSDAPIKMQSGTNNTTPQAGGVEYDGLVFYGSHVASARGVIDTEQFATLTSNYTLTSQTALQKIFNVPSNGAVTLTASTTYFFEMVLYGTGFSGSPGYINLGFGGTATLTSLMYEVVSNKHAVGSIGNCQSALFTVATASQATNSNTSTAVNLRVKGKVIINAGGTFIPQIGMSVAIAAVIQAGTWFRIWPVGTSSVTTVGNWS